MFLTRDLVTEPPNVIYPETLAKRCKELTKLGLKVEVLGEARMRRLGMGALLGVGQGSARESKLVVMQWLGLPRGKAPRKGPQVRATMPVCFIGKGVTFDTGGISLKPSSGMEEMKYDMGGSGVVIGLMKALAGRKARVNAVGVVGLAEEFGEDPLPAHDMERIVERVDRNLAPFEKRHRIGADIEAGRVHMLGTSGTVTTLGAIYLDLPRYDRSRVDGLSIRLESAHAICAKLVGLNFEDRHNHPCIGPGRADLMVMGCAILTAIFRRWPVDSLTAADRGIRDGLLLDMMAADGAPPA